MRAVIPVHVLGHPTEIEPLRQIGDRYALSVIEDAAEALGSSRDGRHVGADAELATLSFNGNKIVTTGGGGAILTHNEVLARDALHLTTTAKLAHPWAYDHDRVGFNYRLPGLNAALGCAQLERLPALLDRKRELAQRYAEALSEIEGVSFFSEPAGARSNYWLNALLLDPECAAGRDALLERLHEAGILARPLWTPMHRLPMYHAQPRSDLSVTDDLVGRLICLPSSARLGGDAP